jgi:hypothetical protein
MPTLLPTDENDNVIPAIRLKGSNAHSISVTATSAKNSTAFDAGTRITSLYATEDIYIKFGDSSVIATTSDHFFPKGTYYDFSIGGGKVKQFTHIAAIQVSTPGTLYISEKE